MNEDATSPDGFAFSSFKYTVLKETATGLAHCRLDDERQAEEFFAFPTDHYIRVGVTEFVQQAAPKNRSV